MSKISVIVPVYNVQEYIEQCIESILSQSMTDMEIIVIDDGSLDESINKVKKFNDKRIKIICKNNGGLSSARNVGIENASGEFIVFVDSDDYIVYEKAIEEMYQIAKEDNSDIVVGNAVKYFNENKQSIFTRDKELFKRGCMNSSYFLIQFRMKYSMHSAVWLNMYKTNLIRDNNILFKEGFMHEDEDFTPRVFLKSKKVSIYPREFYMYRAREGSIINTKNSKKGYDLIKICIGLQGVFNNIENLELKKVMAQDAVILLMKASYENKIYKLPKGAKFFVLKNTYDKKLKLHSLLYSINTNLYYKFLDKKLERV